MSNNANEPITDVLFRVSKEDDNDVYALFPGHAGNVNEPHTCSCFQHIGQHSSADLTGCVNTSRPAMPFEYEALKRELESNPYGYRLNIVRRSTVKHYRERVAQLAA